MVNSKWIFPIVAFLILGNLRAAQGQSKYTTLASFEGQTPDSVILDNKGNIFGTTYTPDMDKGIVFEVKKGSHTIITLASFQNKYPDSIALDGSGNIFGITALSDVFDSPHKDTIFEILKDSHTINTLAIVPKADYGKLCLDAQGNIFGTLTKYHSKSFSVFELKKGHHDLTFLASIDGNNELDRLNIDSNGNIFGMSTTINLKGGSIFEIIAGSHLASNLATFDGETPDSIGLDDKGNIFGLVGNFSHSTIFELAKGAHTIIPLSQLDGLYGNVILDNRGNIFGIKYALGKNDFSSSIFKLPKDAHAVINIATFQGDMPEEIMLDDSGTIFGWLGSILPKGGTIFEIPHDGKTN